MHKYGCVCNVVMWIVCKIGHGCGCNVVMGVFVLFVLLCCACAGARGPLVEEERLYMPKPRTVWIVYNVVMGVFVFLCSMICMCRRAERWYHLSQELLGLFVMS